MVLGVIIVFFALALLNALVMLTSARRDELGLLRLVGVTPRQVRRMMLREA
jgi:putative ABC transport system permease protein